MSGVLGQDLADQQGELGTKGGEFDYESYAAENIGEGKRWASADEALAALAKKTVHQDTFIDTLKLEKKAVEMEKQKILDSAGSNDKLDELYNLLTTEGAATAASQSNGEAVTISKEDIQSTVQELLDARTQAERDAQRQNASQANQDKAFSMLSKSSEDGGFGSEAAARQAIRQYVGDSEEKAALLNNLGATQPEAVAAFLKTQVEVARLEGDADTAHSSGATASKQTGLLSWADVQRIKKDNPELYKDRRFQMKIHEHAGKNPSFWD